MSSSPKSFPPRDVFWFTMQIFAEVAEPEFHDDENCCHVPQVAGAVKFAPSGIPLIENCKIAGLELFSELTHVEKL